MNSVVVRVSGLSFAYHSGHEVLHDVSLTVHQRELVAVVGPSGGGKSTLLRCIAGLEEIDDGVVFVDGRPRPGKARGAVGEIGMIFQQFNLFAHRTVRDNIVMPLHVVDGIPTRRAAEIADDHLAQVGLADLADRRPSTLSGGQQQRLAIARMLAMRPKVLLLDEITSALDSRLTAEVLSVIRGLADAGMPMLMVTHELAFAKRYADRLIVLQEGRVIDEGTPAHVLAVSTGHLDEAIVHNDREL